MWHFSLLIVDFDSCICWWVNFLINFLNVLYYIGVGKLVHCWSAVQYYPVIHLFILFSISMGSLVPIYDVCNIYLYSILFWNGACIIVPFVFVLICLLAFIFLFFYVHILHLAIYPPDTLWFDLFCAFFLMITWFSTAVTSSLTRFWKWRISDDWNRIIYFLCGFLLGVLDFISIILTVAYLTSVVIMTMIVNDIYIICYIYRILIVLHKILRW